MQTIDFLLSLEWQEVLATVALEVDLNTAEVENLHAFAKRVCSGVSVELMSATSFLRQSKTLISSMAAAVAEAVAEAAPKAK